MVEVSENLEETVFFSGEANLFIWSPFNRIVETLKRCYLLLFSSYLQVVIIKVALLYCVTSDLVAVVRLDNTVKKVTEQDI